MKLPAYKAELQNYNFNDNKSICISLFGKEGYSSSFFIKFNIIVLTMIPSDNVKKYFFGEHAEFDHAGIAVRSISNALKDAEITEDPVQRVNVAFMNINNLKIELIEPMTEKSPITNILDKGQTLYHLCFRVPDIKKALDTARKHGFHSIARPVPAKAFNDNKIAWVFSKVYGLFELIEAK